MRRYQTIYHKRQYARRRREVLRSYNLCINGMTHGTATCGVLCSACRDTHRRSA